MLRYKNTKIQKYNNTKMQKYKKIQKNKNTTNTTNKKLKKNTKIQQQKTRDDILVAQIPVSGFPTSAHLPGLLHPRRPLLPRPPHLLLPPPLQVLSHRSHLLLIKLLLDSDEADIFLKIKRAHLYFLRAGR